jgi:FixJ family two-component response regulator
MTLRVREGLSSLLRASGKGVRIFSSGQEFLDFRCEDSCACLILDLKMPGLGELEVQRSISAKTSIPFIFITGRGDIPSTVTAMKGVQSRYQARRLLHTTGLLARSNA